MIDYKIKALVIGSGLAKYQRQLSRETFKSGDINHYNNEWQRISNEYKKASQTIYTDIFYEAIKVNNASYKRTQRLKQRVTSYLQQGQCIFLTLTFTDDTLANTTELTRRRYVIRYLKSQATHYVANIDYGAKNDREHYHALIQADMIDYTKWHTNGSIKGEIVHLNDNTDTKLAKYINKLTNHAIKNTNKRQVIIYSKE